MEVLVGVELVKAGGELVQRDVDGAVDMARFPLVVLAHVEDPGVRPEGLHGNVL
jgi:hypothetical protein